MATWLRQSTAVDIGLGQQGCRVVRLHAAAVKNLQLVRDTGITRGDLRTNVGVDFLRLLGGGRAAGTNGPNRLIGDDGLLQGFDSAEIQHGSHLLINHLEGGVGFALFQGFTDTQDGGHTVSNGLGVARGDQGIGLAVNGTAFGVTDDREGTVEFTQHDG